MGKLGWFMSRIQTVTYPPRQGEPAGTTATIAATTKMAIDDDNNNNDNDDVKIKNLNHS